MGLNLFTVQPLFSGEVFAQYKLILLPFSVRNLIAPQPQTIVPNPIPPGTSPPPDELGEALFLFFFIPLHCHLKRQLPHSLSSISLKYPLQQVKNIASSSTHHQQTTTPNPTPPGTSPPSEGLGEAALSPFLFLLWAWGGSPFIFQIFPSIPPLALKY